MHAEARHDQSLLDRVEALAAAREAQLDRNARRRRGIVHTPAAIARYIVAAADRALREDLGLPRGLASPGVVIVDPATGPGVFLAAAIDLAGGSGAPRACVGLDVDAAALEAARTVLAPAAAAVGWPLALRACDALETLAPLEALRNDDAIRVVLGNPPWASRSARGGARAIAALLDDFRRDEQGEPLRERKIGVLADEYVRFLRWSAEIVRRARRGGVIAMVTNASYLDGPVHRGMRAALARWLDRLDVVDLGGSALVARAPGRDENVFGVRPGAAILVGVRSPGPEPRQGRVRIATLSGSRQSKLACLARAADLDRAGPREADERRDGRAAPDAAVSPGMPLFRVLDPRPAGAPWVDGRSDVAAAYASWPSLPAWMPFHREGLQTNRDALLVATDRAALLARLERFAEGAPWPPYRHWDQGAARTAARALLDDPAALARALRPIAYRPLDGRLALVHPALCHRPRPELARAIDASGLALVTTRKDRGQLAWCHVGAATRLPDNCWLSTRSSCRARAFPLYDPEGAPNLDPAQSARLADRLGRPVDPATFAHWALAWMAAPAYRRAFDAALRAEPPRIPAPASDAEFDAIAAAGRALAGLLAVSVEAPARAEPGIPLRADAARGRILRGSQLVAQDVPPAALTLRVGHHVPLLRWLQPRPEAPPAAVAAAIEASVRIAEAIDALDAVVGPALAARLGARERDGVQV